MKKTVCVLLVTALLFTLSACKKNPAVSESIISSDISVELQVESESPSKSSSAVTEKPKTSSSKKTTSNSDSADFQDDDEPEQSQKDSANTDTVISTPSENTISNVKESSYKDIACANSMGFQKVNFITPNSNTLINITMPVEWTLKKSKNGYNITKNAKTIGSISTSASTVNGAVNVFYGEITANGMEITHSIDRADSDKEPSYTRTLCYNYDDEHGNHKSIVLTVPYQEVDSSAIAKMMEDSKKGLSATEKNMGVLQIQDTRNKILILGNSFVNTSRIGYILQAMCGTDIFVEAHSRGYASVTTYTDDDSMMQSISAGNYSAVFMCGFYAHTDGLNFVSIVNACNNSNTKLAIFPAHNESRSVIDSAITMYPNTVLIDWKSEIDSFINIGIDNSNFCIADSHKHSTPLAGYVGAHMIYRAIFNKIPQNTSFNEVSKEQISILGNYTTSGSIDLLTEGSAYLLN